MSLRTPASRSRVGATLMAVGLALAGAPASGDAVQQPDKLVVLSTTDVKGKTGPCG